MIELELLSPENIPKCLECRMSLRLFNKLQISETSLSVECEPLSCKSRVAEML